LNTIKPKIDTRNVIFEMVNLNQLLYVHEMKTQITKLLLVWIQI